MLKKTACRKEANKDAERLQEAAQAEWRYVPPPAVHHPEIDPLLLLPIEEDLVDLGFPFAGPYGIGCLGLVHYVYCPSWIK